MTTTMTQPQLNAAQKRAKTVEAAMAYVLARPGREMSLSQIANGIGVSRQTLQDHFIEATGISFTEYLTKNQIRLDVELAESTRRVSTTPREYSKKTVKAAEEVWQSYLEKVAKAEGHWA